MESLLERAQKNMNPMTTKGQILHDATQPLPNNQLQTKSLEYLHKQVQSVVSADKLAEYIAISPRRARAEIKNAAAECFRQPEWDKVDDYDKMKLLQDLIDFMFGFGPIENLIDDATITEVMINGTNSIYYERDGKLCKSDESFGSDDQVRALIDRILGPLGRRVDESSPMVNARLSSGHRVNAIIPPLALDGPVVTIRKFSQHVITMDEMIGFGSFDEPVKMFLKWCVLLRKNVAVSGGTGSGKTTLLNAMSCEIPHSERIITIEDSAELRFLEHPHVVRLEARAQNSEGTGEVTIRDLVINALRMRPDRIVVGECRGAEALDMLQAMNTGHDGSLTTLHANSPQDSVSRMTTMVRYAVELPVDVIEAYIASALDYVVQVARAVDGSRYVSDIVYFGFDSINKRVVCNQIYLREPMQKTGSWVAYPEEMEKVVDYKIATEVEFEQWKKDVGFGSDNAC